MKKRVLKDQWLREETFLYKKADSYSLDQKKSQSRDLKEIKYNVIFLQVLISEGSRVIYSGSRYIKGYGFWI